MEWFKHKTNSLDDPDFSAILDEFGSDGYMMFFGLLEIYGREYSNVDSEQFLNIRLAFVARKLRKTSAKVTRFLSFCGVETARRRREDGAKTARRRREDGAKTARRRNLRENKTSKARFVYKIEGGLLLYKAPDFIDLSSNWTKRNKKTPTEGLQRHLPLVEEEVEEEEDKDKRSDGEITVPFKDLISHGSIPKVKSEIQEIGKKLYDKKTFPEVFAFINKMLKGQKSERAILHTLTRCYAKGIHNGGFKKDGGAWAYCMKIIQIENGNYNELEYGKTKTASN